MERNIIKQGYELINSRYKLTTSETKFVLGAIAQIKMEDTDFHEYVIPVAELEDRLQFSKNKHTRLKAFAKALMSKPLTIDTDKGFEVYNWFSKIKYVNDEAVFKVQMHKDLRPYLLQMSKRITKTNLKQVIKLSSNYAIRIFHLLKEYEKIGHRDFEISELHELMQTPKSYQDYSLFRKKVLDVAVKEINKHTDIEVSYKVTKKIRKRVTHIKFEIRKNKDEYGVFLEHIRREYINVPLATIDDIIIKCSEDGLLYNSENNKTFKKEIALKYWERMYANREEILKVLSKKYPMLF
jgi:plasmid replication initiation protein